MHLICQKCVESDSGLKKFVITNGQEQSKNCSYCSQQAPDIKKIELKQLINHIYECLEESYTLSESKSQNTETISDFMDYLPNPQEENNSLWEKIQSLIKERVGNKYLIEKKELISSWDNFSDYIKKENRFFFSSRSNILGKIMKIIEGNNLRKVIKPPKKIYRARAFKEGNRILNDLRRMGPPHPKDISNISNRMSPPGVPIFYGSFDKKTALSEISQEGKERLAYVAEFQILKEITIIDLTIFKDEPLPSFFDPEKSNRNKRRDLVFIKMLCAKLSEPISKDGREHTDYVPTQIFSEYIKINGIQGIIYESSRSSECKNIALFFSHKNCSDKIETDSEIYLKFVKTNKTYSLPIGNEEKELEQCKNLLAEAHREIDNLKKPGP